MQHTIKFFRDLQLCNPPKDVCPKLLRQCDSPRRAMRVSLKAAGLKLLACSRMLGISEGYLSKLVNEKQAMPDWFVPAFCWATGSNLLEQHLRMESLLATEPCERALDRRLADELRAAA